MTIDFRWGVKIPLRDGTRLNATLYLPAEQSATAPCVCTLTPYISDSYHDRGMYFAAHGMPFAIVDVRGRGNSEGRFQPLIQEARDGYDVIEWLAKQSFCNGKVAMWGGSYAGYVQWAAAKEFPPHLAAIAPAAAPCIGVDFPMRNNIFYPHVIRWLTYTAGRALQTRLFNDDAFWSGLYRSWYESGRPFRELDSIGGHPSPVFQEWLDHPEPDEYWDAYNPTDEQYSRLDIPILSITGIYDDDQPGALEHYKRHIRHAGPAASARHALIVGPWDHAGTRTPALEFGGLKVGAASRIDLPQLHLEWYAWAMQGGKKPAFLKKAVAYYVMEADEWRHAESLAAITAGHRPYYLNSDGRANDVFASGTLEEGMGTGPPDSYTFDPREAGPELDAEARASGASLVDQSVTMALGGKQLVYHGAPFVQDVEISGFFRLTAWISIDGPDADLYVSVHEIAPDGTSVRLATDALRARYREGLRTPKLIDTPEPLRFDFDRFTFVSRLVRRGHRLRLVIAPLGRLVEATFAQKNYQAGGVVANESARDARAVTVRVFHDALHPSALHIPLGAP